MKITKVFAKGLKGILDKEDYISVVYRFRTKGKTDLGAELKFSYSVFDGIYKLVAACFDEYMSMETGVLLDKRNVLELARQLKTGSRVLKTDGLTVMFGARSCTVQTEHVTLRIPTTGYALVEKIVRRSK